MQSIKILISVILLAAWFAGCGINSVSKRQIKNVKAGDVLTYRYQKADGKSWFYTDKITRVESDRVFYNPGRSEATIANDSRLKAFLTDKEMSIFKEELLKYETEQGSEKKIIIWIN